MEEIKLENMSAAEKHPFEHMRRIAAKDVEALDCNAWSPPVINEAGHLVQAQPRTAARRDGSEDYKEGNLSGSADSQTAYDDGFKQGKQAGLQAGKEEGIKLGKQEAIQIGRQELQPKLKELNLLLTNLSNSLNEEDYKLEQTLMQLVKHIAEAVIRHEIKLEPGQLMKVIKETISALPPNKDNIKIHVSPSDKQFVDEAIDQGGENWRAVVDEALTQGGLLIETDQSVADFSIENRISTVLEQLYEQQAICPKPGEPGYEAAPEPAVLAKAQSEQEKQQKQELEMVDKSEQEESHSSDVQEASEAEIPPPPLPPHPGGSSDAQAPVSN